MNDNNVGIAVAAKQSELSDLVDLLQTTVNTTSVVRDRLLDCNARFFGGSPPALKEGIDAPNQPGEIGRLRNEIERLITINEVMSSEADSLDERV